MKETHEEYITRQAQADIKQKKSIQRSKLDKVDTYVFSIVELIFFLKIKEGQIILLQYENTTIPRVFNWSYKYTIS